MLHIGTIVAESALEITPAPRSRAGREGFSESHSAVCQHCGRHPFALPGDEDDEQLLWQAVEDGDRADRDAPSAPTPEEVALARRALAAATAALHRVEAQVRAVEIALTKPSTWLRPGHRMELAAALRRGRAARIAATSTRESAARAYADMDRRAAQRRSYLVTYREVFAAATEARRELDRRIDDAIDAYGKMAEPPAWFRFGLGYPPRPESYTQWLARARKAIAYRRRHGIDHPLEPTGGVPLD
jgi:hypothetical protein